MQPNTPVKLSKNVLIISFVNWFIGCSVVLLCSFRLVKPQQKIYIEY